MTQRSDFLEQYPPGENEDGVVAAAGSAALIAAVDGTMFALKSLTFYAPVGATIDVVSIRKNGGASGAKWLWVNIEGGANSQHLEFDPPLLVKDLYKTAEVAVAAFTYVQARGRRLKDTL